MWNEDIQQMIAQYESRSNLHYFIPYFRDINESHCSTIINWTGTEIQRRGRFGRLYDGRNVGDFIEEVIGNRPWIRSEEESGNSYDLKVSDIWLKVAAALGL